MSTDGSRVEHRELLLGAAVETFVPEDTFTRYLGGTNLLGLLAALVVATCVAEGGTNVSTLGSMARVMGRGTNFVHCGAMGP